MNTAEAAIAILREAGKPLRFDEIAKRMLASGFWTTKGRTPAATVSAAITGSIKKKGTSSPFIHIAKGVYGLRDSTLEEGPGEDGNTDALEPESMRPKSIPTSDDEIQQETLSFTNAAEKVLQEFGEKQPMHYVAITEKAIEHGWLKTEGKTPAATMYAQVLTEIKKDLMRGARPRFVKHGKGYVGLVRWMGRGLAFQIEQHNKLIRQSLHKQLQKMDPFEFEELIARLLAEIGFEDIEVTKRAGDGGIDVRGTLVVGEVIRTKMAVQVKKWKKNVQAPTVQQVRGSLGAHEQGLIITTSDFSKGAGIEAARVDAVPVALMNGEQLVALLVANGIGVSKRSHELIELGESEAN